MRVRTAPLSLGWRIVASVALGLALILGLFGFVALWTIRESTEAAYGERVTLAEVLVSRLDDALRHAVVALEREAGELRLGPGQGLTENQQSRLTTLRGEFGMFAILSVLDADGATIWTEPSSASRLLGDPFNHPSARVALRTGKSQITEFTSPVDPSKVYACLAMPLRGPGGATTGVLMAEFDPAYPTLNLLPSGEIGEGLSAQLVSRNGQLLTATAGSNPRFVPAHLALLASLVDAHVAGYRVHETPPGSPMPSHIVAYAPSTLLPSWGVTAEQPRDIVLALPYRLQERLLLFGVIALLVTAAIAWFDTRRVVRPLQRLTAAAERFAAGQLDEPVGLKRTDELGILARAFETMRQRLRASLAEVAEWNRSALVEPERVITLVLQKARDVIGADVAGLGLVEEGGADMSCRLLVGGDRFTQMRLGHEEGLAGHVVRTGEPVVVSDWQHPPAGAPAVGLIIAQERLRSTLAVPLQSGGRTFGMLMVGNRAATIFSDDQVTLLSGLANQAAVALENARLYRQVQGMAVLEERERIAREMHDGFGQVLGYVNTKAMAVNRLLEMGKVEEARAQVAQLEVAAKDAYADVREAILGLRTTRRVTHGLLAALREYLEGFEQQSGIPVELQATDTDLRLSFAAEIQLLRIVQEALTNVRKHAQAGRAVLRLETVDGLARLEIADDGVGFERTQLANEAWHRFGLETMRERAEAVGGTFVVESSPGAGTSVRLTVPRTPREGVVDGSDARPAG